MSKSKTSSRKNSVHGNTKYSDESILAAYEQYGTTGEASKSLGMDRRNFARRLKDLGVVTDKQRLLGKLGGQKTKKLPVPKTGVKRYLITAAQNDTKINDVFWQRLNQLAEFYSADIYVCPFTYSPQTSRTQVDDGEDWYAPELQEHLVSERVELAPGLVLCAEITRVLPTAARPLSGLESYTGRASSVFPHAKIAMETVPSMKDEPTKFMYTTGAVTKHNYSRTKAGFKGEFHHAYGALLVEVTSDGWWCRHINADTQNRIYDLDICVDDDGVTYGNPVEALVYGDVHVDEIDPVVAESTWGYPVGESAAVALVDFLQPAKQVLHDFFDMRSRPWQDELNPHRQFEKYVNKQDSVGDELDRAHEFYQTRVHREWSESIFVRSNHDLKLERWLASADYRRDYINTIPFLELQLAKYTAIENGDKDFNVFEYAMRSRGMPDNVKFLREDESYVICKNRGGGIECGQHGHLGANGSKGTPRGLAKLARKQFIGDKHSPCIVDGLYTVGTCTGRDVAYARGPSSWSPTHGVAYENGKRALLTMWKGRFYAPRDDLPLE